MTNIYYTAREGRRNANGHTTTRGEVYVISTEYHEISGENIPYLWNIGEYTHQSGGAGIELAILTVCEQAGIDTNGGYYKHWRKAVCLNEI